MWGSRAEGAGVWGTMPECALRQQGMGKGEQMKGKGKSEGRGKSDEYYNNFYNGKGEGGQQKGGGKGFGGECWTCGEKGH